MKQAQRYKNDVESCYGIVDGGLVAGKRSRANAEEREDAGMATMSIP